MNITNSIQIFLIVFLVKKAEKVQEEKPYEQARTSTQRNGTEKNAG